MRACKSLCSWRPLVGAVAIGLIAFGVHATADPGKGRDSAGDRAGDRGSSSTLSGQRDLGGGGGGVVEFVRGATVGHRGQGAVAGPPPAVVFSNTIFGNGLFDPDGDLGSGIFFVPSRDDAVSQGGWWLADDWELQIGTGMSECIGTTLQVAIFGGGRRCFDTEAWNACSVDADCSDNNCQDAAPFDVTVDVFNRDPSGVTDDLLDVNDTCIANDPGVGAHSTTFTDLPGLEITVLEVDLGNTAIGGAEGAIWVRVQTTTGSSSWVLGSNGITAAGSPNDAEIGFSEDLIAINDPSDGSCEGFGFGVPQASMWGNLLCESAVSVTLSPNFATGTECPGGAADDPASCDWYIDGPTTIVLHRGGQDVSADLMVSDWDQGGVTGLTIGVYQTGVDCATFGTGKEGTFRTAAGNSCGGDFGQICNGVDDDRLDWVHFGVASSIPSCTAANACADGLPGFIQCGTVVIEIGIEGAGEDHGFPAYGNTYGFVDEDGNAKGTFTIGIDANEGSTFIRDLTAIPIAPIARIPMTIVVQTGACCGNPVTPFCEDNLLFDECAALGGNLLVGAECSGVDENPQDGLDDVCPVCDDDPLNNQTECDDGNSCTFDDCDDAVGCTNVDITTPGFCCNPNGGAETQIDDGDACTIDECITSTGQVTHTVEPGADCDDGNGCTFADLCQDDGSCLGTNTTGQACDILEDCPVGAQSCTDNLCVCTLETKMTLDIADGSLPDGNCYECGDTVSVDVNMGAGSECVTGGQFLVNYDPACMSFSGISSGGLFPMLLYTDVDEVAGTVFAAVGVMPGSGDCTQGPANLATITFTKGCDCGDCAPLCYGNDNPQNTILTNTDGQSVPLTFNCSKVIRLAGDIGLSCPDDSFVNADCDASTAIVTYAAPTGSSSCEGPIDVSCESTHSEGADVPDPADGGGEYPQGTTTHQCTATDSCGKTAECEWTVDVSDQHAMDVVVQLEPIIVGDPMTRCVCFEFYSDCVQAPSDWCVDLVFGGPYDFIGHATPSLKVPKGQFACLTAKDPLHTLRSVSGIECVGNTLVAEFKGDPSFGGNWLIGGNLDCWKDTGHGDTIDILDFGMFLSQFMANLDANTPCGTAGPHSDINGDGVVDTADFSYISRNFLKNSKNSCCDPTAGFDEPLVSITVKELIQMGLGDLVVADINHDGTVDQADMAAFLQGGVPTRAIKSIDQDGGRSLGSH